jgi:outer membrane autotransporter protein
VLTGEHFKDVVTVKGPGASSTIDVTVTVKPLSSLPDLTDNQRNLAGAFENAAQNLLNKQATSSLSDEENALLMSYEALVSNAQSSPSQAPQALQSILPDEASSAGQLGADLSTTQLSNIGQRLSALKSGQTGFSMSGMSMHIDGNSIPAGILLASLGDPSIPAGSQEDEKWIGSRLGGFLNGRINWGGKDETDKVSGYDFETFGLTAGIDYLLTKSSVLGGSVGYGTTDLDLDSDGGSIDINDWTFSVYGIHHFLEHLYLQGILSYGIADYDQERNVHYTLGSATLKDTYEADFDGTQLSWSLGLGYDFTFDAWTIGISNRIDYTKAEVDSYQEEFKEGDGGGLNMVIEDNDQTSVLNVLGVEASYTHSASFGVLVPKLRLDWEHEFEDDSRNIEARFAYDPGKNTFEFEDDSPDRNFFRMTPSVSIVLKHGLSAFLSYETVLGKDDHDEQSFYAGIRKEF